MKDIDVFMLTTFYKQRLNLTNKLIADIINRNLPQGSYANETHVDKFEEYLRLTAPKDTHVIHALIDMGYQPKFIAEYMKIAPASVSYHIKKEIKPYINAYWSYEFMKNINSNSFNYS